MKKQVIEDLMKVNIQDTKSLVSIASNCTDNETKAELLNLIGIYQERWSDLYQLSWK